MLEKNYAKVLKKREMTSEIVEKCEKSAKKS